MNGEKFFERGPERRGPEKPPETPEKTPEKTPENTPEKEKKEETLVKKWNNRSVEERIEIIIHGLSKYSNNPLFLTEAIFFDSLKNFPKEKIEEKIEERSNSPLRKLVEKMAEKLEKGE